jgi:acylphosphatase
VQRIAATVSGQVQGVGFRWFVVREARGLGVTGWVANAADGSVRLEAQGDREAVGRLLELLREGPPGSRVQRVESGEMETLDGEDRFAIRSMSHPGD